MAQLRHLEIGIDASHCVQGCPSVEEIGSKTAPKPEQGDWAPYSLLTHMFGVGSGVICWRAVRTMQVKIICCSISGAVPVNVKRATAACQISRVHISSVTVDTCAKSALIANLKVFKLGIESAWWARTQYTDIHSGKHRTNTCIYSQSYFVTDLNVSNPFFSRRRLRGSCGNDHRHGQKY